MPLEQLKEIEQESLQRAVERATIRVTENLGRVYRRRLLYQLLALGLVILAIVGFGSWIYVTSQATSAQQHDLALVCRIIKRGSSALSDFVRTDARFRLAQDKRSPVVQAEIRGLEKIFSKKTLQQAIAHSNAYDKSVAEHWLKVDLPALEKDAHTNCNEIQ